MPQGMYFLIYHNILLIYMIAYAIQHNQQDDPASWKILKNWAKMHVLTTPSISAVSLLWVSDIWIRTSPVQEKKRPD